MKKVRKPKVWKKKESEFCHSGSMNMAIWFMLFDQATCIYVCLFRLCECVAMI